MTEMILNNKVPRVFHLSSDFFSMVSIAFLTLILMPLPLVGNMLLANLSKEVADKIIWNVGPWLTVSEIELSWMIGAGLTLIAMYIYLGFIVTTFKNTYQIIATALTADKEYSDKG